MKVLAPGKLVLTGAYAVLEGAPAIVVAVDRYARVDVQALDKVDTRAMYDSAGHKLGLGSSAASMVAAFGARSLMRGEDLLHPAVRAEMFRAVRASHHRAHGGGSGVDVAASVHGGALRYTIAPMHDSARAPNHPTEAAVRAIKWPAGLILNAFWSGTSARTSGLLARVDALRARGGSEHVFARLRGLASEAADAVGDAQTFVHGAAAFGRALATLGSAADAPIVPSPFADLASLAEHEGGAFLPSGAGGGDVGIWLGVRAPSSAFVRRANSLSLSPLVLDVDYAGVRAESVS